MNDKQDGLQNHVNCIAESLTNPHEPVENEYGEIEGDAMDWLSDALDFQWIISSDKTEILGARILVAFGGPDIWVDTKRGVVEGYWWGDYAQARFIDNIGLDDALQTIYNC